ncbi:MAG: glycosyltransferase [Firmicutes bacterium]|nr:glycosyltransferase [Bacillota bacterium]
MSAGILERRNGSFFGKGSVVQYLHDLSKYFDTTYFIPAAIRRGNFYNSQLDIHKVIVIERIEKGSLIRRALDFIKLSWKVLDQETAVLIFLPDSLAGLLFTMIRMKAGRVFVYVANDWRGLVEAVSRQSSFLPILRLKALFYEYYHKAAIKMADGVIVRGAGLFEKVKRLAPTVPVISSRPITLLPQLERNKQEDTCQERIIKLLYVGGLYKRKGVDVFLRSVRAVFSAHEFKGRELELHIVGVGEEESSLKELAVKLGIDRHVIFYGWVDDPAQLWNIYRRCDIFVLPSIGGEGFPRVIDEAMCNGLPVIATRVGSIPQELRHGFDAYLVEPNREDALAEAIIEIILNSELRQKLIRAGFERCLKLHQEPEAAEQHSVFIHFCIHKSELEGK